MKGITANADARTVRVEAGCTWGEVNDALQPYELAAAGGFVSIAGVSGLTLGGGLGWLVRKYGPALDNLISTRVVLADGGVVTASASENADPFWALRGGGGNFGIVTEFEFKVHPAGTVLAGSCCIQDTDRNITWTRGLVEAMRPFFADAAYVNYLGGDEGDEGLGAAYGAEKIARLAALKGKYDAGNMFRMNQNVKPATAT